MARPIVVGIDGSAGSGVAVAEAAKVSGDTGAKVYVVFGYEQARVAELKDHAAAVEELGIEVGSDAIEQLKELGVDSELRIVNLSAVDALIGVADEVDAQMIVVANYGDSPLKGAILGSTPYKLVHISKRPVLVVHGAE
jgi:nucleotide-binding universal stress UspA family protein